MGCRERNFLRVVVLLQRLLQLARDFLEEGDLLLQVVLHLRLEVAHADLVEVLDLGQRGAGDDVAALVDPLRLRRVHFALLHVLLALLHLRQGPCRAEETSEWSGFAECVDVVFSGWTE